MQIILASRSPRRKKALRTILPRFRTLAVPEPKKAQGKTISQKTCFLALAKCRAAARRFPHAFIIAADTLASCGGKTLGKPRSAKEARSMLERMNGKRLEAVTSIAVGKPWRAGPGKTGFVVWSERGWVKFRKLEPAEISRYVRSGRWKGKAAAVNVEEKPVRDWIERRGGGRGAVTGLPLKRLQKELRKCCDESC